MKAEHNFLTPRNLYEKLLREAERLNNEPNGDNFFNFIATAYHLEEWIKKSPISSNETAKRILRKISRNPFMKQCCKVVEGQSHFIFRVRKDGSIKIVIDEVEWEPKKIKDEILQLFETYFKIK